jgi:hypothetical protein
LSLTPPPAPRSLRRWWLAAVAVVFVAAAFTSAGRRLSVRFFESLRIAKPAQVSTAAPAAAGPGGNRRLLELVGGMIAESLSASNDEPDRAVANTRSARQLGGFTAGLLAARPDTATLTVMGAHVIAVRVNRTRLATILAEAGEPGDLPSSLEGATLRIRDARRVRAQYGHCPVPVANTLQNQLQGPPPTSPENADCVVLTQGPLPSIEAPEGLAIPTLVNIALELSGMSPVQSRAFQERLNWKAVLSVSIPRFLRSCDSVRVSGAPGMLLNTAGRRGPSYELIWANSGMVYTLTGYGSAAEAVPLAASVGGSNERR